MAPVLERCDREGVRAYLDATSERNRPLYERHGFQAEEPFAPPGAAPVADVAAARVESVATPGLVGIGAGDGGGVVPTCARSQG